MMKRCLTLLVILTAASCTKNKDIANEQELEQAIHTFNFAFRMADVETLDRMISERYVHTNGSWKAFGREDWLGYMEKRKVQIETGELKVSRYEMQDLKIEIHGTSAFVTGMFLTEGEENGESFKRKIRISNFWVIENGEWKRAGFHDTHIENPTL